MPTATEKYCSVCGADVRQAGRTKDAAGNYYCEGCVRTARHRPPQQTAGSAVAGKTCQNCGSAVGALQELREWDGHRVCTPCRDQLEYEFRRGEEDQLRQAESDRQTLEQRKAARSRAFWGRLESVCGVACCGPIAVFFGAVMLRAWRDENSEMPPRVLTTVLTGCFGLITALSVLRYRRLGRKLAEGDTAALLSRPGIPGFVGTPFAIVVALAAFAVCTALGVAAAALVDGQVMPKETPAPSNSLVWWFCVPIGLVVGLAAGAVIWEKFRETCCPRCRQYDVAEVQASQHVGTDVRTYHEYERLYTKAPGGSILSTTDVPVSKQELVETRQESCRCRNCGHEWSRLRSGVRR